MTFFVAWSFSLVQPGRSFGPAQLSALYFYVALVQLLIAWILYPDERTSLPATAEQPPSPPRYPPDFVSKLPPAMRRGIIALEAEDHYVRVHTLHGSTLVLMRLADAVAMFDPRLGLRVHRSWWVARDGVRAIERTAGRAIARLVNDTEVPISRAHLPEARTLAAD